MKQTLGVRLEVTYPTSVPLFHERVLDLRHGLRKLKEQRSLSLGVRRGSKFQTGAAFQWRSTPGNLPIFGRDDGTTPGRWNCPRNPETYCHLDDRNDEKTLRVPSDMRSQPGALIDIHGTWPPCLEEARPPRRPLGCCAATNERISDLASIDSNFDLQRESSGD